MSAFLCYRNRIDPLGCHHTGRSGHVGAASRVVSQASARRSLNKPLVPGRKTPGRSKAWDRLGFGALALLAVAVLSVIVVALGGLTSSAGDAAPHVQIIGAPEALPGSTPVPAVTDAFTAPAIAWPIADLDPEQALVRVEYQLGTRRQPHAAQDPKSRGARSTSRPN